MDNIFASGRDDYMFPVTMAGMRASGIVLEHAGNCDEEEDKAKTDTQDVVLESDSFATRSRAMSAVLTWLEEGDYTYDALDEAIVVAADIDGDYDLTEDEEEEYSDIWEEVPSALLTLGADSADVQELVDGPGKKADEAAARVGAALEKSMNSEEGEDSDIIADFASDEDAVLEGVFEATYKRKKVVRDGKVQIVRKRVSGKVRLSAAQKAGLRKARRKAFTAKAKLNRKKSMRKRAQRGLK